MTETWQFLAGLGLFLLGMMFLEDALSRLTGASFKSFIRSHTRHPAEAIVVGIIVTAVLQSSSLVTLMLLALTGAGVMALRNALGVVIGANLGTTFTGWIVATLGFKLNLDQLALPLVGLGCIGYVFLQPGRRGHEWFRLAAGFGFLFLGLGFMKTSAEGLAEVVDIRSLAAYGLLVFLLFGFLLTAIIQSSSACMMIVLAAVNAGIIDLSMAAAVVIGADLGTTMTTILGALKGSAVKRQVALAHFLFNLVTDIIAFLMIGPLLGLVTDTLGITDPLYGTVAFHSSFNIIGILIFYPFLGRFAEFLEHRFRERDEHAAVYFHRVPVQEKDIYIEALHRDLNRLLAHSLEYVHRALGLPADLRSARLPATPEFRTRAWPGPGQAYGFIKDLQGEIIGGCIALQEESLSAEQGEEVSGQLAAARTLLHAVKSIKDIEQNLGECSASATPEIKKFQQALREEQLRLHTRLLESLQSPPAGALPDAAQEAEGESLKAGAAEIYDRLWTLIREIVQGGHISDTRIATLNSINREVYSSGKSLADVAGTLRVQG